MFSPILFLEEPGIRIHALLGVAGGIAGHIKADVVAVERDGVGIQSDAGSLGVDDREPEQL